LENQGEVNKLTLLFQNSLGLLPNNSKKEFITNKEKRGFFGWFK